jgi:hypothetical protein
LSVDVWQPSHDTRWANDTLVESLHHIGQTHEWQNPNGQSNIWSAWVRRVSPGVGLSPKPLILLW